MNTTKTIAKVNGVSIQIIDNGEKMVPIKPICEALGIDFKTQFDKIKSDEFLSSTMGLSPTVGADGKGRDMSTIPYKYIFGWLFTINPKNVKPEAQEAVMKFRMECYDALYEHFTEKGRFLDEKQVVLNKELDKLNSIKQEFNTTKALLLEQTKKVEIVRHKTFEEWKDDNRQGTIPFVFKD